MPALLRAAHAGPAVAVVVLAVLLGVAEGLATPRLVLLGAAVLAGQLSVGWSNDLVDEARDRLVARSDKPLATGAVHTRTVRLACAAAVVAVVPLSLALGLVAGAVHLLCVASAWAYNLGLKSTVWSWLPYAVSFGGLVVFVSLAGDPTTVPDWWRVVAGGLLGVGAHLVNVLPDLADDARTDVRGLPHRIGARWLPGVATAVLVAGSVVVAVGAGSSGSASLSTVAPAMVVVALLAVLALTGRGRLPFLAAIGIALADVALLVAVT